MTTLVLETQKLTKTKATQDLPTHVLRNMAATFIHNTPAALSDLELANVAGAVRDRIAKAESHGLAPSGVVRSLLSPVFAVDSHCRCRSCQERCAVCRSSPTGHEDQPVENRDGLIDLG